MKRTLLALVAALAFAAAAGAAEGALDWQTKLDEKLSKVVSVNFQDITLNKALEFFRRTADVNIILDSKAADLSEKRLTLVLTRVRAESGLAWTARLMGLDYIIRDEAIFLAKPDDVPVDWRGEMQERYRKMVGGGQEAWLADIEARLSKTVKVAFRGDPLPQVVAFLAIESGINIVLDYHLAEVDKPIRLEGEMTVKSALGWMVKLADVRFVVRDEVVYIASQEALAALRLETGESPVELIFRRPVTFHFQQTPLKEAVERLSRLSGVAIEFQGLNPEDPITVSIEGEQVEIGRAVRMVMNDTGRPYVMSLRGKTIQVIVSSKPVPKPPAPAKKGG